MLPGPKGDGGGEGGLRSLRYAKGGQNVAQDIKHVGGPPIDYLNTSNFALTRLKTVCIK